MHIKGKIAAWDDEKGYGFIRPHSGGDRVLISLKAFVNQDRRPKIGDELTYRLVKDKQGRPCAKRARFAGDFVAQKPQLAINWQTLAVLLAFLSAAGFILFYL